MQADAARILEGALLTSLPLAGNNIFLLPQKAAYLPDSATLLIADVHLGKAATFMRAGMPMLPDDLGVDLTRLSTLINEIRPRRIIFMGDLFHHRSGLGAHEMRQIMAWRAQHAAIEMLLITGNHDRGTTSQQRSLSMESRDSLQENGLHLTHYPELKPGFYNLAGHVHPVLVLFGKARQRRKLPCFYFGKEGGILPAFGLLTGGGVLDDSQTGRYYVCSGKKVIEARIVE